MKIKLLREEQRKFLTELYAHIVRIAGRKLTAQTDNTEYASYIQHTYLAAVKLHGFFIEQSKLPKAIEVEANTQLKRAPYPASLKEKKLAILIKIYNLVAQKYSARPVELNMLNIFSEIKKDNQWRKTVSMEATDIESIMSQHRSNEEKEGYCAYMLTTFFFNPKSCSFLAEYGFFTTDSSYLSQVTNPSYGIN